jgi:hypothetical protein
VKSAITLAAMLVLVACSPSKHEARETRTDKAEHPVNSVVASAPTKQIPGFEGYPTTQPNGAPLTEDYCVRVGDKPGSPFDNTKTCLMIACQLGDKASCKMMETYNGNLWPNGVPPEEGSQTNEQQQ